MEKALRIKKEDIIAVFRAAGIEVEESRRYPLIQSVAVTPTTKADLPVRIDIPAGYKRIAQVAIYTDINDVDNKNLVLSKDLTVDSESVIDKGFPTKLLFPKFGNEMYTNIDYELDGQISVVEAILNSPIAVVADFDVYIMLILEK